jgi:hypothetical protein
MKLSLIKYLIIVLFFLSISKINSQTCGFGCLGLSGVYGGYSVQQYEADGLNQYIGMISNPFSSLAHNESNIKFKEGKGFKVGINLVRANYSNFFFTFKGYYQFLSEDKEIEMVDIITPNSSAPTYNAKLEMNNWGIGLDFGIPLFGFVDWKIMEGELKFFSPKLSIKSDYQVWFLMNNENTFTPDKVNMGYSIGSGLIFNIVRDYVSLEVTGMYSLIKIDNFSSDIDGSKIPSENSDTKFISKGGIQGIMQLNVGIPF